MKDMNLNRTAVSALVFSGTLFLLAFLSGAVSWWVIGTITFHLFVVSAMNTIVQERSEEKARNSLVGSSFYVWVSVLLTVTVSPIVSIGVFFYPIVYAVLVIKRKVGK